MNILTTPPASLLSAPPAKAPAKPDKTRHFAVLADDGNARIRSLSTYETNAKGEQVLDICRVLITTYDQADIVSISVGADHQLNARINGKDYKLPLTANNDAHSLRIKTAGGNDRINVDEQINIEMHIHGGDGDDFIVANGRVGSVTGDTGNTIFYIAKLRPVLEFFILPVRYVVAERIGELIRVQRDEVGEHYGHRPAIFLGKAVHFLKHFLPRRRPPELLEIVLYPFNEFCGALYLEALFACVGVFD